MWNIRDGKRQITILKFQTNSKLQYNI